nr:TadE/TadG family type IV pilus assembly protein [Pseudopontixanthobacter vadosimaris]
MEFGLTVTIFMTLLLGLFDIGQMAYTKSILTGAAQEAARASSLETGDTAEADAKITEIVRTVAPGANVTASRVSYFDFNDIGRPEAWNDEDADGTCDDGETYTDENGNGQWDDDVGTSGNGGASDVVIYEVDVSYDPLFPNPFLPGGSSERMLTASAVKKNQPFADQDKYGSSAGSCE